ncbi:MAG: hypothetical protein KatS3mg108_1726 [Isosphaeraceae bacterium]|jgi:glycerol-3-phosphate acyltransferase PlsY|nr:MAG: hypothetical protein KatS3mg108_1726 [Isosphaeraceae bacterium]
MDAWIPAIVAILAGYVVGSIPTAYLLVRAVHGSDIRQLGSGNVGATNAGRVLGRWAFWLVFLVDLLKGLGATLLIPLVAQRATTTVPDGLAVLVAAAAILGHNFPIWLGFRGGKGVATTLGAVLALEPVAAAAAALAFLICVAVSRVVSLSSIVGMVAFLAVYFVRTPDPWSNRHRLLSWVVLGLAVLLIWRHRANLVRIARGTEPRIGQRVPPTAGPPRRSGRVSVGLVWVLVGLVVPAFWVASRTSTPHAIHGPGFVLEPLGRVLTGYQRAGRLAFFRDGRTLAVACPRYDRLVFWDVTADGALGGRRDVRTAGSPVALAVNGEELIVVQRPSGDARHLRSAFWQRYDRQGRPVGSPFDVGFDPDDLAIIEGGTAALVLLSGNAEGESNRPDPSLVWFDLVDPALPARRNELRLGDATTNPTRLYLSRRQRHAGVATFEGDFIGVALADGPRLSLTGRIRLDEGSQPTLSHSDDDWIILPGRRCLDPTPLNTVKPGLLAWIDEPTGQLCLAEAGSVTPPTRYQPTGPLNRGTVRATALSFDPNRGLLALADRSGGVRLLRVRAE